MVSRKYLNDYTIEYVEGRNGKLKARAVYKGKYFTFVEPGSIVKKTRNHMTLLLVLTWCAYIIPLLIDSSTAKTFYVIFPHTFVFIPMSGMSFVAYHLWTQKLPLTRQKSDFFSLKAPAFSFFMALLSGFALAGCIISSLTGKTKLFSGEIIFWLCETFLFTASCLLFGLRKQTATRELPDA